MPIEVREISAPETYQIRLDILRPGLPLEEARFAGDELETTRHFGAFAGSQHVGVASIYLAPLPEQSEVAGAWQLRGMATVPEVRGQGAGRALLLACIEAARAFTRWCIRAVNGASRTGADCSSRLSRSCTLHPSPSRYTASTTVLPGEWPKR